MRSGTPSMGNMKKRILKGLLSLWLGSAVLWSSAHGADEITGAGSSAAAPAYRIWAQEYQKAGGDPLDYDPVGSGAGMARIKQRQADFGASDVIAPKDVLAKDGLVMFPTVVSGIVPVVNLRKAGAPLRLSGEVLARIFLGEISHWQAPEIHALNPGVTLPNEPIRVVCRSDSSGSTHHFSDYLSKLSPAWKARFGVAGKHPWPAGFIAVKGSAEVSKTIRSTPGAIGYIDYSYVLEDGLTPVQLRAAGGRYVSASPESFRSAVVGSRWFSHGDFSEGLTHLPAEGAWPITMGTYVALPKVAADTARTARALRFLVWAYGRGDALARQAKFVPLPEKVQARAFRELSSVVGSSGEPIGMSAVSVLVR